MPIPFAQKTPLCPVLSLEAWLRAAGITAGPIWYGFNHGAMRRTPLTDGSIARLVQRSAERAGPDPSRYGGHSLRAGFATTAAQNGKALAAIQKNLGHASSRTTEGYVRTATAFEDSAAVGLL